MILLRLLIIILGLAIAVPILLYAAMFTAFAGSSHGAPSYYLAFIGITQALPILAATVAWVLIIFTATPQNPYNRIYFSTLLLSIGIYALSFGIIFSGIII